jgi:hypothetical protein
MMIVAFGKTREQVSGERREGAHGQQFRDIDQDLDGHVHPPRNPQQACSSPGSVATPK